MADPLRKNIKYICELFKEFDFDPRVAIADSVFSRVYNIYQFSIAENITDTSNYWIAWGGYYDNPEGGYGIQIFMNSFLVEVFTTALLQSIENSFYVDKVNDILYMNIPLKPWQYYDARSGYYSNIESTFSTAPKDINNLSDIYYGVVKVDPKMKVPSLNNKLNDIISGIRVYNSFSISINNEDGIYDGFDVLSFFNTPMQISKGLEDDQDIEDLNLIQRGIISDIDVSFNTMKIKSVDKTFLFNSDVCKKFLLTEYPGLGDSDVNKDIPVGWGSLKKAPLIEVNKDTSDPALWIDYISLDKDYITAVSAIYDSDGISRTFTFNATNGIIRATELDGDGEIIECSTSDVTGITDNSIGEIIISALSTSENLPYVEGIWDITETNQYLSICADIGFYFDGGITKKLIEDVLKSDNAFLIQKNNGLLTLRQWGQTYDTHEIDSWLVTKNPQKNFRDATKYYCSSTKVFYEKNNSNSNYNKIFLDDSEELDIFKLYKKSYIAKFETDFILEADAEDFSSRILDRFGEVRETIKIGLGVDTFNINLLDTITYDGLVNDRQFSNYTTWIVKECDPGQDILVLEGEI